MATYSVSRAAHKTLSGTTVDTVTFTDGDFHAVEVYNRAGTSTITFTTDGTTPTALGNDGDVCLPGEAVIVVPRGRSVKVIGNGNDYSVSVVDR